LGFNFVNYKKKYNTSLGLGGLNRSTIELLPHILKYFNLINFPTPGRPPWQIILFILNPGPPRPSRARAPSPGIIFILIINYNNFYLKGGDLFYY